MRAAFAYPCNQVGVFNMRSATSLRGETVFRRVESTPSKPTPREAAKEFSAKILDFSVGELAQAANTSKQTAKCWKSGRAFPSGVSLLALMAEFDTIQAWADSKTGAHREASRNLSDDFERLERIMLSDTAQGRAMRARFLELSRGRGE